MERLACDIPTEAPGLPSAEPRTPGLAGAERRTLIMLLHSDVLQLCGPALSWRCPVLATPQFTEHTASGIARQRRHDRDAEIPWRV